MLKKGFGKLSWGRGQQTWWSWVSMYTGGQWHSSQQAPNLEATAGMPLPGLTVQELTALCAAESGRLTAPSAGGRGMSPPRPGLAGTSERGWQSWLSWVGWLGKRPLRPVVYPHFYSWYGDSPPPPLISLWEHINFVKFLNNHLWVSFAPLLSGFLNREMYIIHFYSFSSFLCLAFTPSKR